jgi:hypothetical protein
LAGNKLDKLFECVGSNPHLTDLSTEGNPVEQTVGYILRLKDNFSKLKFLNFKNFAILLADVAPMEVIKPIVGGEVK